VQSTTRYRKGNASRRHGSGHGSSRHGHGGTNSSNPRVLSGRKGGVQASKSKKDAAHRNGGVRRYQNTSAPANAGLFGSFPASGGRDVKDGQNGQAARGVRGQSHIIDMSLSMGIDPHGLGLGSTASSDGYSGEISAAYFNGSTSETIKSEPCMDEPVTPERMGTPDGLLFLRGSAGCSGSGSVSENYTFMPQAGLAGSSSSSGLEASPYTLSDVVVGMYGERTGGMGDGPPLFCEADEVPGEIARSIPAYCEWNGVKYEF